MRSKNLVFSSSSLLISLQKELKLNNTKIDLSGILKEKITYYIANSYED